MLKVEEKWAIVGDTQCPFHDPRAVEIATLVIEQYKPDHIVYNGDMWDFWSISKHNPRRWERLQNRSLQDEINIGIEVEEKIGRGLKYRGKRHHIDGNHEDRLEAFLGTGPQAVLGTLKSTEPTELFRLRDRGISSYSPYGEGIWITENLFVYHGAYVGALPGDSVKKELQSVGASVIMNHVHRRADLRFRQGKHEHRGIENGCLCQLKAGYKVMTNWSQCLTLVDVYDNKHWNAEVVDIIHDDDCVYAIFRGDKISVPLNYQDGLSTPWRPSLSWSK
jgi:hypothetical protein